jgi:hypothetical protein
MHGAYLFVLLNVSQAGLELVAEAAAAAPPCWLCCGSQLLGAIKG